MWERGCREAEREVRGNSRTGWGACVCFQTLLCPARCCACPQERQPSQHKDAEDCAWVLAGASGRRVTARPPGRCPGLKHLTQPSGWEEASKNSHGQGPANGRGEWAREGTSATLNLHKPSRLWSRSMNPQKKVDLKLIIVGALGVGKTSLLHQYVHNTFYEDYQTTLGASILSKIIRVEDTTLKLQIWDTGGQERFRSVVSTFYKGSDGCILAFDVTDLESFEALDIWRGDVLAKIIPVEQPYPMVVLGNKIDLADRKYRNILESHLTDSIKLSPHQARRRCC
ncbi:ras-related protein Rab-7b isoform X1 [Oryctolagus cuniculus]|uniref:ras-related protein Rab-7b isoform X1 n=1 Tax=Oryctolagus cuniculus TaxID=9986 RepID=UPI003879E628